MCGIAGWYCLGEQRPNPQALRFLWGLQSQRGHSASGLAWMHGNKIIVQKSSEPSASAEKAMSNAEWGKIAKSPRGLMHARATTKGSEKDNRNNHPVTDGEWFVVHNGHVRNDDELFEALLAGDEQRFAEVDTAAIPLVLSKYPTAEYEQKLRALSLLDGAATVAVWGAKYPENIALVRLGGNAVYLAFDFKSGIMYWSSVEFGAKELGKVYIGPLDVSVMRELPENHGVIFRPKADDIRTFAIERRPYTANRYWSTTSYKRVLRGGLHGTEETATAIVPVHNSGVGQTGVRPVGQAVSDGTRLVEVGEHDAPTKTGLYRDTRATFAQGWFVHPHPQLNIGQVRQTMRFVDPMASALREMETNKGLVTNTWPTALGMWRFNRMAGDEITYEFLPGPDLENWWRKAYPTLPSLRQLLPITPGSPDDRRLSEDGVFEEYEFRQYSSPTSYKIARMLACPYCGQTTALAVINNHAGRCPMCKVQSKRVQ